jgi:hypothetical protein
MSGGFGIAQERSCTMSEQVLHHARDVMHDVKANLRDARAVCRSGKKIAPGIECQWIGNSFDRIASQIQ